jgi:hypothetical protein
MTLRFLPEIAAKDSDHGFKNDGKAISTLECSMTPRCRLDYIPLTNDCANRQAKFNPQYSLPMVNTYSSVPYYPLRGIPDTSRFLSPLTAPCWKMHYPRVVDYESSSFTGHGCVDPRPATCVKSVGLERQDVECTSEDTYGMRREVAIYVPKLYLHGD